MTCSHAQSLIEDYVDNELTVSVSDSLREHLRTCPECRAEYESTLRLKDLLSRNPAPDPGDEYWSEVKNLILARTVEPAWCTMGYTRLSDETAAGRSSFFRSLVSVAASLCIFFGALLLGTSEQVQISDKFSVDRQSLAAAPLIALADLEADPVGPRASQNRIAEGILLLGPPGSLSRLVGLADIYGGTR